jgi:hypothetical protein
VSSLPQKRPKGATPWPKSRTADGWRWELGPESEPGMSFPEPATAADRKRAQADVVEFFRNHRDAS